MSFETTEKIVYVKTEDGLTLEGLMLQPLGQSTPSETIVWFHGLHQKFSEMEYVNIGRQLAARGYRFITANLRSHDFGTWFRTDKGAYLGGSAWELFSESPFDIAAWIDFAAKDQGRVILAGHGLGGAKVVYYQAERRDPRLAGLIIASSGSLFRDKIRDDLQSLAEDMIAGGRDKELLPWGTRADRQVATISAASYMDLNRIHESLYGYQSLPPALARITCPILAWYGAKEKLANKDIDDFLARVRRTATASSLVETRKLAGVEFFYTGSEKVIAGEIARWCEHLRTLQAAV